MKVTNLSKTNKIKKKENFKIIIQVRLSSSRLPKKVLKKIYRNQSMLEFLLNRLSKKFKKEDIIIALAKDKMNLPIMKILNKYEIKYYEGSENNVLSRYYRCAQKFKVDNIIRITADCPFVDPFYADKIVDKYLETNADLIRQFDLPHGVFSYGVKVEALRKVVQMKDSSETEVWGHYFTDTGIFNVIDLDVEDMKA